MKETANALEVTVYSRNKYQLGLLKIYKATEGEKYPRIF